MISWSPHCLIWSRTPARLWPSRWASFLSSSWCTDDRNYHTARVPTGGGGGWRERERVADRHTHTHTLNRASHTYTLRQTGNFTGVISPPPSKVCVFLQFFQKCFHLALKSCARRSERCAPQKPFNNFFFSYCTQNRDIVENWQWQEGSGATTHSTSVLNPPSVPRVVAIRGLWPAWLTFKVNCVISAAYYIITANAAHPGAQERSAVGRNAEGEFIWSCFLLQKCTREERVRENTLCGKKKKRLNCFDDGSHHG